VLQARLLGLSLRPCFCALAPVRASCFSYDGQKYREGKMTVRTFFGTTTYVLTTVVACVGLVGFAVSRLPWVSSTQTILLALSMILFGAGGLVVIGGTWCAREPLLFYGVVRHSERPTSYHTVAALQVGCLVLALISGLRSLWSQIASGI
jgi:hypothetical protein